jgi:hypothetical protein
LSAQPFFDHSGPDPLRADSAAPGLPVPVAPESGEPELRVHVDPDAMLRDSLAAGIGGPGHHAGSGDGGTGSAVSRHGAGDGRQAARRNSERARSGRAAGAGGGRSYAFRRS